MDMETMYGRSGKIPRRFPVYKKGKFDGFKNDPRIAPPELKKKIDDYWMQRDKVDELLLNDKSFQKLVRSKDYLEENGLGAFFWISFFAIKHKIYPLK